MIKSKKDARMKVRYAIRKKIAGTAEKPRLAVYRSNRQIYAQLIDDTVGCTLGAASSKDKSLSLAVGLGPPVKITQFFNFFLPDTLIL